MDQMIASPSMSVAFWWQCVTSKTRLETPVCVPLHSVALSMYEDVLRSSPCPSHPLYRHINGQMSSNSESPLRSIKKPRGMEKFPKKYWMSGGIQSPLPWKCVFESAHRSGRSHSSSAFSPKRFWTSLLSGHFSVAAEQPISSHGCH